jgi:hypothetical protein
MLAVAIHYDHGIAAGALQTRAERELFSKISA